MKAFDLSQFVEVCVKTQQRVNFGRWFNVYLKKLNYAFLIKCSAYIN